MNEQAPLPEIRVDKWLWAARFFKTRQLAIEAINGGKVQVDGQRAKPSRSVRPGSRLEINKGGLTWEIQVLAIDKQRRPASEAARLYEEAEASRLRRQERLREIREMGTAPGADGRPTKRDRRQIQRFTGRGDSDA
ncbi:RNA-binding S4 domain-containing protein [Thiocystis violacea]|uniref:RNA-binding S4 domain-containing protein n=1 Tax=Thiocystis violacea TaxID=13725 RepID=UPI001906EC3B|nr:S4 domain-containing protein [Thiocystis violacea]MBK1716875.1 RNA-binding protein S4 [Thiocystis violacea]